MDVSSETKVSQTAPLQKSAPEAPPPAPTPAVAQMNMAGLSARERNMLKRKMKQDAKNKSKDKYVAYEVILYWSMHILICAYRVRMLDLHGQRPAEQSDTKAFATPSPVKVENDSMFLYEL